MTTRPPAAPRIAALAIAAALAVVAAPAPADPAPAAGPAVAVACPPAGADPATPAPAPRLTRAEVGAEGELWVEGEACPGAAVELFRAGDPKQPVAASRSGECGLFVAALAGVAAGEPLVAVASLPGGSPSQPSEPLAVSRTDAPEVVVETAKGSFVVRLRPDRAPKQTGLFLAAVRQRAYDGTTFHRVVPEALVQGGDPLTLDPAKGRRYGRGGHGRVPLEGSGACFTRATVGAARCPQDCDTGGRQFFVLLRDEPALRGHYTAFGDVVAGLETVEAISRVPSDEQRALERVEMRARPRVAASR